MVSYLTDDPALNSTPRAALHVSRCNSLRLGIARLGYVPPATDSVIDAVLVLESEAEHTFYFVRPRFWDTDPRTAILQTPPQEVLR